MSLVYNPTTRQYEPGTVLPVGFVKGKGVTTVR